MDLNWTNDSPQFTELVQKINAKLTKEMLFENLQDLQLQTYIANIISIGNYDKPRLTEDLTEYFQDQTSAFVDWLWSTC